jgi:hypothetical protein
MANFVKWRGAFNDQGSPSISHSIQMAPVGQAFRFGIWGGDGLAVGPNDPSIAQLNPRATVEGTTNNIIWYELVGLRESNVIVEARNPGDRAVWDYFQLAVKAQPTKIRPAVRGINFDYLVDTKGIGPDYNASMVLTLNLALTPLNAAVATDANGTSWPVKKWSDAEWRRWVNQFQSLIIRNWSEKFWLATPPGVQELEVTKSGGGKKRVNLHCVLKLGIVPAASAQHRIEVVKVNAPNGVAFRSDSTKYDNADIKTDPPAVTGFAKSFTTAIHEIGHTLGLHHPCEAIMPATPYCVASHPDSNEIMGMGNEYRARYASPWQNAAAAWFNSAGKGHSFQATDFNPSMVRLAPVDV